MTTQSSYNMMRDPRMVIVIVLFAVVAALAIWAAIADPLGGAVMDTASPSVAAKRAEVFATAEAQSAVEAKLPKGSALLPINVTAAERVALEANGGRVGKFVELLASFGPWREVQVDRQTGMPVLEGNPGDLLPVLFLARDGKVFAAATSGVITDTWRLPDGVAVKTLPEGTVEVAAGGKTFLVRAGEAFFLEPPRLDSMGVAGPLYFYFAPIIIGADGQAYEASPRQPETSCELPGCKVTVQPKKDVPPPVPIPTGTR